VSSVRHDSHDQSAARHHPSTYETRIPSPSAPGKGTFGNAVNILGTGTAGRGPVGIGKGLEGRLIIPIGGGDGKGADGGGAGGPSPTTGRPRSSAGREDIVRKLFGSWVDARELCAG
jgi:hypothetical protein